MYKFLLKLDEAQLQQRREYLNWYANLAQISIVFPILAFQLILLVEGIHRRGTHGLSARDGRGPHAQDGDEVPSSPYLKRRLARSQGKSLGGRWRSLKWWLGEPAPATEYSRGEILAAVAWAGWLLLLIFLQTGEDYLHLTKRFGIVAASQLPFHYLLSVKSPYSPIQWAFGLSHESLNPIHQLLGRIIILLFATHVTLYTNFFVQENLLGVKLTQAYVLAGYTAFTSFAILGSTALSWVRRKNYRLFYAAHIVCAAIVFPALWIHVSHIRIYLYEGLAVYVLNLVLRSLATERLSARITPVPGAENLLSISFPSNAKRAKDWVAGHHGYISAEQSSTTSLWRRGNPFTVAVIPTSTSASSSSSDSNTNLAFVARIREGQTRDLNAIRHSSHDSKLTLTLEGPYGIKGPYGTSIHVDKLLLYDRVLIVAGGIGGTFCAPVYSQLLAEMSPSKGSRRRLKVQFVWTVKKLAEMRWAVTENASVDVEGFVERLTVHVTGGNGGEGAASGSGVTKDDADAIELQERDTLLASAGDDVFGDGKNPALQLAIRSGRPNLASLVEGTFAQSATEHVAVVVCGPEGLGRALRREVGRFVNEGREVYFWEERFAL